MYSNNIKTCLSKTQTKFNKLTIITDKIVFVNTDSERNTVADISSSVPLQRIRISLFNMSIHYCLLLVALLYYINISPEND